MRRKKMKRKGKSFIDANIIIHANVFERADVFQWINDLYEEIYIHIEVLNELKVPSVKNKVQKFIESGQWKLFDPEEETCITTDALYDLYLEYVRDIQEAFRRLDEKKVSQGRPLKNTNDLGEMHSLAAAMLLSASIICSNDLDIREVIADTPICITIKEEEESMLMQQDTLEDLCCFFVSHEIAERSIVRKFLKAMHPERVSNFDLRIPG